MDLNLNYSVQVKIQEGSPEGIRVTINESKDESNMAIKRIKGALLFVLFSGYVC